MRLSASHQYRLLKDHVSPALIKTRTRTYLSGLPCYLLALILAFWNPAVSIGICSVLWLFWAFTSYERKPARIVQQKQAHEQIP